MKFKLDEITFIIVTYKSELFIQQCLDTLPSESNKLIIENSKNINLVKDLKQKYDNIEVILSDNIGMGAGNNIGLKLCKTKYAYVLNPDVKLKHNTLKILLQTLEKVQDFTLASPKNENPQYPNYKLFKKKNEIESSNIISVDSIDGFSMLFNLEKFTDKNFFDENFFLYLENDDLCLRVKQKGEHIFVVRESLVEHRGGIGTDTNIECLRNWHWMWSKFYYNKKHNGFYIALSKIFVNFFSSIIKLLYHLMFLNFKKSKIYKFRILGIISSVIGKKSYMRLKDI